MDLLLIRDGGTTVAPASPVPKKSKTPKARHVFPLEQVRQVLQEALADTTKEPHSMQEVAVQLGYPQLTINTHLPDLCQAITRRYQAYRKERGVQTGFWTTSPVRK